MEVEVRLVGDEVDDAELAALAGELRELLRDTDGVEEADPLAGGPPPAGAKSGGLVSWGGLAVSLASTGAFTAVVETVLSWLRRQPADIEVDIAGHRFSGSVTGEQRDALVRAYLARVGAVPDPPQ